MEENQFAKEQNQVPDYKVVILPNGPYKVVGKLPLNRVKVIFDEEGIPVDYELAEEYPEKENQLLCRCGGSHHKPFCDGSHTHNGFIGEETADRSSYMQRARKVIGPNLILYDRRDLCISIGFCHLAGNTWSLTRNSDDPEKRELAVRTAQLCPSGRLVPCDKETGKPIEQNRQPLISLIDDPRTKGSFPIWLRGGIPLQSQDGSFYETRFRVTLCTCGKSHSKPFCDGMHYNS